MPLSAYITKQPTEELPVWGFSLPLQILYKKEWVLEKDASADSKRSLRKAVWYSEGCEITVIYEMHLIFKEKSLNITRLSSLPFPAFDCLLISISSTFAQFYSVQCLLGKGYLTGPKRGRGLLTFYWSPGA